MAAPDATMISKSKRYLKHMSKDPICGMIVDEKKAQLKSVHEGVTFYFCSPSCKKTFDGDPHKFAHK